MYWVKYKQISMHILKNQNFPLLWTTNRLIHPDIKCIKPRKWMQVPIFYGSSDSYRISNNNTTAISDLGNECVFTNFWHHKVALDCITAIRSCVAGVNLWIKNIGRHCRNFLHTHINTQPHIQHTIYNTQHKHITHKTHHITHSHN